MFKKGVVLEEEKGKTKGENTELEVANAKVREDLQKSNGGQVTFYK
jgi:hypothetical protein